MKREEFLGELEKYANLHWVPYPPNTRGRTKIHLKPEQFIRLIKGLTYKGLLRKTVYIYENEVLLSAYIRIKNIFFFGDILKEKRGEV